MGMAWAWHGHGMCGARTSVWRGDLAEEGHHRGRRVTLSHFVMERDALLRRRLVGGEHVGRDREARAGGARHCGCWQLERRHELREVGRCLRFVVPSTEQDGTVRAHEGENLCMKRAREGDACSCASVCVHW